MKYNLSIASVFRDELPYLLEWIEYHRLLGVQHFYLSNNDFNKTKAAELLKPYIENNIVTLVDNYTLTSPQHEGFRELISVAQFETKWLALLDIDEFIYPQKYSENIYEDVLKDYEKSIKIAGIAINWCVYGTGNHVFNQDLVTQSFIKRSKKEDECNKVVKLIIRTEFDIKDYHSHSLTFYKGHIVNTKGTIPELTNRYRYYNTPVDWYKLRINHYPLKSLEEFLRKSKRGNMGKCSQFEDNEFWSKYFAEYNLNTEKDTGMLQYGEKLRYVLSQPLCSL